MTLILTVASNTSMVQVADRRLTDSKGSVRDDMAVKMISVTCQDAHFSIAYTGLAEVNGIRTDERVVDYLASINAGNMPFPKFIESFRNYLTSFFGQLRSLGNIRAITFALAGFGPRGPFWGLLSNVEDEKGNRLKAVDDSFHFGLFFIKLPLQKLDVMVNGAEITTVVFEEHIPSFRKHFFDKSPSEISRASVQLIRRATSHPNFGHVIGKNCMSAIVFPDGQFVFEDYPEATSPQHHSPHVIAPNVAYKKVEIWTGDEPPPWWKD